MSVEKKIYILSVCKLQMQICSLSIKSVFLLHRLLSNMRIPTKIKTKQN